MLLNFSINNYPFVLIREVGLLAHGSDTDGCLLNYAYGAVWNATTFI